MASNCPAMPTIRITTKCTQRCGHCCFECSPERSDMMSIPTAERINQFLVKNDIHGVNVMGGEFYCNPDWPGVIEALTTDMAVVRLVTNGDWATSKRAYTRIVKTLKRIDASVHVAVSKDEWHTNKNIGIASNILTSAGISYNVAKNQTQFGVVPIGRGILEGLGFYSMFGAYCMNPKGTYSSFLINEAGDVFKCPFGLWHLGNVDDTNMDAIDEFNESFKDAKVMTCMQCIRVHDRILNHR